MQKDQNYYHIRVNKPLAVYKKIKILRWRFIEIFPKFSPKKAPKSGLFRQKSGGLFEFCIGGGLIKSGGLFALIRYSD